MPLKNMKFDINIACRNTVPQMSAFQNIPEDTRNNPDSGRYFKITWKVLLRTCLWKTWSLTPILPVGIRFRKCPLSGTSPTAPETIEIVVGTLKLLEMPFYVLVTEKHEVWHQIACRNTVPQMSTFRNIPEGTGNNSDRGQPILNVHFLKIFRNHAEHLPYLRIITF